VKNRHIYTQTLWVESLIAGAVFVAVAALLAWAVVRRRAGAGAVPSGRAERQRLEAYYVGVLAVVAAALVVFTAWQNHRESTPPRAAAAPVRVDVTGFQWCWRFGYPQAAEPFSVTATCRGKALPTLVVPAGRPVTLTITSHDVIHSLWVPALRYKMDAFPDHVNTVTLTLNRRGRWIGRCAEFCGLRHFAMDFWIKAVSPEEYAHWLHAHGSNGSHTAHTAPTAHTGTAA
jgi:cytochrome c oxidase subunit 2